MSTRGSNSPRPWLQMLSPTSTKSEVGAGAAPPQKKHRCELQASPYCPRNPDLLHPYWQSQRQVAATQRPPAFTTSKLLIPSGLKATAAPPTLTDTQRNNELRALP
ncbi:hypothetical protein DFP72DRAFT_1067465 [Ephemerocybe angulata]|uniref:Uncharacterized protein n=1 Tax=Ephemerocybe angulata TaxID=980116 RepID=A0A8H6M5M7_9AGAR|nr:hypothetical protein DFP72DRAFT_1067465 [Tulosesus angulatus]